MGSRLQIRRQRREGVDLPGALSLPGCYRRAGYRCLRQGAGEFPLSRRKDREGGAANRSRRALSMAGVAARAAQGIQACAQLRLFASQLQARDRIAACAAQVRSRANDDMVQTTRADSVHMLRGGDDDREDANSVGVHCGRPDANCSSGVTLIV